jgi:putative PIG3 family NAD(P)H quinone oxidoreductase
MIAIVASRPGGPDVLEVRDIDIPSPGPNQVVIRVSAAGLNRADIRHREGGHPPAPGVTETLGLEVSGEIVSVGENVATWKVGDSVCALLGGGGYAEYALAEDVHVLPIPRGMSLTDAGGIVEVAATVWANIFRGELPPAGSWILFHGGTSGIGTFGTQLAVALGFRVATTCGSRDKVNASLDLGATLSFDYTQQDFARELNTQGIEVSRVLDHIGGPYIAQDVSVLALDGHIASIGNLSGQDAIIDMASLMRVRGSLSSASLRARTREDKADILTDLRQVVWPLYESGLIKPVTFATFGLRDVRDAHVLMESSAHIGKILLLPHKALAPSSTVTGPEKTPKLEGQG